MDNELQRLQELAQERQSLKNLLKVFEQAKITGNITLLVGTEKYKQHPQQNFDPLNKACDGQVRLSDETQITNWHNIFEAPISVRIAELESEIKELGNKL